MTSRAVRVSTVSSCVHVIVVMLVRFHLGSGMGNVNRVLALMMTVMALHIEVSVCAD